MSDSFTFADPVTSGSTIYSWDDPLNWSTGTIANGATVAAILGGFSSPAPTITVGGTYTLETIGGFESSALVSIDGGSLTILQHYVGFSSAYGGGFAVGDDGSLNIASSYEIFNGLTEAASGTIDIASATGTLQVDGGTDSNLAGAVTGAGTLYFRGGNVTLDGGVDLAIPTLTLDTQATLQLAGDVSYGGAFQARIGMALNGHTLTLSGQIGTIDSIGGTADTGRVIVTAASGFEVGLAPMPFEPNYLSVGGNDVLEVTHAANQVGALYLGASGTDAAQLQIDAGAQYTITGGDFVGAFDHPDLGSVVNAGTLLVAAGTAEAQIQSALANSGTATVQTGTLLLGGPTLVNTGALVVAGGATLVTGSAGLSGTGTIAVLGGGSVELGGSVAAGQSIALQAGSVLRVDAPAQFAAELTGFAAGATLDLANTAATLVAESLDAASGLELLSLASGTTELSFLVQPAAGQYVAQQAGADTQVTLACFVAGTRIATERGLLAVEALAPGERVLTTDGSAAVTWLGHRTLDCRRHPRPQDVWPVRIAAHAFGQGRPCRDVLLSPDHAVFCEGVLIPVRYLLNGATLRQLRAGRVAYWHVELTQHAVLFADGLPAESYLDTGNRRAFANGGTVAAAHPEFAWADFARAAWAQRGFAPLVTAGPERDLVYRRLIAQALALGWHPVDAGDGRQCWQAGRRGGAVTDRPARSRSAAGR